MRLFLCVLLSCLVFPLSAKEGWTLDEMMQVKGVQNVQVSPDGKKVIYEVKEVCMSSNTSKVPSSLYFFDLETKTTKEYFTSGKSPRWSPDGKWIAYLAPEKEEMQLWIISSDGKEKRQLTKDARGILTFRWSPQGEKIAFIASISSEKKSTIKVVGQDLPTNHLFVISIYYGGPARQLTHGEYQVSMLLSPPCFNWSPDGQEIVFSRSYNLHADSWQSSELAKVDVKTGVVYTLCRPCASTPHYSPDGKWIAFVKAENPEQWALSSRIYLLSTEDGTIKPLAPTYNQEVTWSSAILGWSSDSKSVYATDLRGTKSEITTLPINGDHPKKVNVGNRQVVYPSLNTAGTFIGFTSESFNHPQEAYILSLQSKKPEKISRVNQDLPLEKIARSKNIRFRTQDGYEIEGILTYPINYSHQSSYPLLVVIHGGPAFHFRETFIGNPSPYPLATFASQGYAILRCNIRGSTGYGKEFRYANYFDWGGKDFQDLMDGVDLVINQGIADPKRLGVMGWSYGGYMTGSVITQTSRFKAASVGAGLVNLVSFAGTTDIHSFLADYLGGELWEKAAFYLERSPISKSHNITTPTLILHGEDDLRVPVSQGYELYRVLQRKGVATQFVIYPGMQHSFESPEFMRDAAKRNLDWFNSWM